MTLAAGTGLSLSTYGTLSAIYRIQVAGLNPLELVLVGTVLEASVFLFEVPTGVVADTISRRLSVIIGVFVIGVGLALEGAVPVFASILLAQAIWGLGYTFTSGALEAWIADELGDTQATARAFLRATQVRQVAAFVGIPVSVALAGISLGTPMIAAGVGLVALGAYLLRAMPEQAFRRAAPGERASFRGMASTLRAGLRVVSRQPVVQALFGATFFLGAWSETFDRLWQAHLLANFAFPELGLPAFALANAADTSTFVWFGAINALALLLSALATGFVRRRVDAASLRRVPWMLTGLVSALMLAVVGFGLAGSFALAVGCYQAAVLLRVVHAPLLRAWLNERVESRTRATVFSLQGQTDAFGQVAGGPALGWLATATSLRVAFVAAALLLGPAIALYARAALGASREGPRSESELW